MKSNVISWTVKQLQKKKESSIKRGSVPDKIIRTLLQHRVLTSKKISEYTKIKKTVTNNALRQLQFAGYLESFYAGGMREKSWKLRNAKDVDVAE